ncbi:hypothetical protein NMY22_g4790 [Coprinellus aureogranulatus]|nr:hypothetical protein NMY22_g4790 [Coprinellus aureogranulatus]
MEATASIQLTCRSLGSQAGLFERELASNPYKISWRPKSKSSKAMTRAVSATNTPIASSRRKGKATEIQDDPIEDDIYTMTDDEGASLIPAPVPPRRTRSKNATAGPSSVPVPVIPAPAPVVSYVASRSNAPATPTAPKPVVTPVTIQDVCTMPEPLEFLAVLKDVRRQCMQKYRVNDESDVLEDIVLHMLAVMPPAGVSSFLLHRLQNRSLPLLPLNADYIQFKNVVAEAMGDFYEGENMELDVAQVADTKWKLYGQEFLNACIDQHARSARALKAMAASTPRFPTPGAYEYRPPPVAVRSNSSHAPPALVTTPIPTYVAPPSISVPPKASTAHLNFAFRANSVSIISHLSCATMSMFTNAHHFNVEKIEVAGQNADSLQELLRNVATGALLNSDERSDAPKCHPETRLAVQQEIYSWVTDDDLSDHPRRILWLTGPAGSGKTTIMNTVGEQLEKSGNLAAAFFFSSFSGSVERSTKGRFVTTIAYQLLQHDGLQYIRHHILSTVARNPAILRMHLKEQMEVLILKPLRNRPIPHEKSPPQVILLDGLDECGQSLPSNSAPSPRQSKPSISRLSREQDQVEILGVLLDALSDPAFPFRVIVASRPEPAIQDFFDAAEDRSAKIFLDEKYNPDADITLFLTSHFARIRRKYPHLPQSWPSDEELTKLVKNSSEQMIYAATVVRFLETPPNPPRVQLELILKSSPDNHDPPSPALNPFEPLDTLYAQILNSTPDPLLAFRWLKAYRHLDIEDGFPAWCLNRLCESSDGQAEHLFASLSALVRVSNQGHVDSAEYTFYHKSFHDFLRDESRYSVYFDTSEEETLRWIIDRFIEVFEKRRPAIPLPTYHGDRFNAEVLKMWYLLISERESFSDFYDERLLACDAVWWVPRANLRDQGGRAFTMLMFVVCHNQVRSICLLRTCEFADIGCNPPVSTVQTMPKDMQALEEANTQSMETSIAGFCPHQAAWLGSFVAGQIRDQTNPTALDGVRGHCVP